MDTQEFCSTKSPNAKDKDGIVLRFCEGTYKDILPLSPQDQPCFDKIFNNDSSKTTLRTYLNRDDLDVGNLVTFIFGQLGFHDYPFKMCFDKTLGKEICIEDEDDKNHFVPLDGSGNVELSIENAETGKIVLLNENGNKTDITTTKCLIAAKLYATAKANFNKTNKYPQTMYFVRTFGTQVRCTNNVKTAPQVFFYKATFEKDTLCSPEPEIETQIFEFPPLKLVGIRDKPGGPVSEIVRGGLDIVDHEDFEQILTILDAIKNEALNL